MKLITILGISLLLSLSTTAAKAQGQNADIAQSACDPEYMEALQSRAWLEAQREIVQNQNLILKPDSVLEYTCFTENMYHLAEQYGNNQPFSDYGLPNTDFTRAGALQQAFSHIEQKSSDYIQNNFGHDYLDGRGEVNVASGQTCQVMAAVWEEAKMMDFMNQPKKDGFFPFDIYASMNDPRTIPSEEPVKRDPNQMLQKAYNNKQDLYSYAYENMSEAPYEEDPVETHLDKILPGECTGPAIPTGVSISAGGTSRQEYICTNPGCTYTGEGCQ